MNEHKSKELLFIIAKEIKRSLEAPVIFVTLKDYFENTLNLLKNMRNIDAQNAVPERIMEIVKIIHLDWLKSIQEVENFKRNLRNTPREMVLKAINYTIESLKDRYKHFGKLVNRTLPSTTVDFFEIQADMEIIQDMCITVKCVLLEKQNQLHYIVDQTEYYTRMEDEIEELMNWLDRLNDNLVVEFSKMIELYNPQLLNDFAKILKQIIDEVAISETPNSHKIIYSKKKASLIHVSATHDLEINKVVEKIKTLEVRLKKVETEGSSSIIALRHRRQYLEERLQSLENLQLNNIKIQQECQSLPFSEEQELRIFNHMLSVHDRNRLVEQLLKLWNNAIYSNHCHKSTSLNVTDANKTYFDNIGNYTVDMYGRKLYTKNNDNEKYQLNERNQLVKINDDKKHIYFYDKCGPYYVTDMNQRIYKAHESASEYILQPNGMMMLIQKEIKEDIDDQYKKEFYVPDGFSNMVRVHSQDSIYKTCSAKLVITEENKYLKRTVGTALKTCLADVVLHQPSDPIQYLANGLIKYQKNVERQKQLDNISER